MAPLAIVDNVFFIEEKTVADEAANSWVANAKLVGLPLHEPQQGYKFNAVGWDWDVSGEHQFMECPVKKHIVYVELTRKWACAPLLSIGMLEKMLGLMVFLATGSRLRSRTSLKCSRV